MAKIYFHARHFDRTRSLDIKMLTPYDQHSLADLIGKIDGIAATLRELRSKRTSTAVRGRQLPG